MVERGATMPLVTRRGGPWPLRRSVYAVDVSSSRDPFEFAENPLPGSEQGRSRGTDTGDSPFHFGTQPTAPPPVSQGSRRTRLLWLAGWLGAAGVIAAGVVVAATVLGGPDTGGPDTAPVPARSPAAASPDESIVYEVTGAGTAASVEFSAPEAGGESRLMDVPLPFRVSVPASGVPSVYTVVAQRGADGGPISCSVGGAGTFDERRADGPFAAVTCSASATP